MNAPKDEAGNLTNSQLECSKKIEHLKSSLCETPSESSECKLCPMKWLSEKGQCYWISDQKKTWLEARDYCSRREAQMVVVQDLEELEFIQKNVQDEYNVWIGLIFVFQTKNWTWIDGSLLNYTMAQLPLSAAENTCGTIVKNKGIDSEMCGDEFGWMCEKKAVDF
ncbi:UNVERIFIED_CONTAM: hypothetical protein K2H54_060152 [Gekko kuhli]